MSAPFWGETPPAPPVSPAEAVVLARDCFGVDGVASPLGSNQETNLRIDGAEGGTYVLKVANPAFGPDVLDLQNKAMQHIAGASTAIDVPVPVAALDGTDLVKAPIRGRDHSVRLLDRRIDIGLVDGAVGHQPLGDQPAQQGADGGVAGRIGEGGADRAGGGLLEAAQHLEDFPFATGQGLDHGDLLLQT